MMQTERIGVCLPSSASSTATCVASSRVGTRINACIDSFGSAFSRIGSPNAAVLPVPVLAWPITSVPESTTGISLAWMSVGCLKPASVTPRNTDPPSPNCPNVTDWSNISLINSASRHTDFKKIARHRRTPAGTRCLNRLNGGYPPNNDL